MSKQQFFVQGTSCKSCEVVIERELKKQTNITHAEVSHKDQLIYVETSGDKTYSEKELNALLEHHDYSVAKKSGAKEKKKRIDWKHVGAVAVFVLAVYIILDQVGLLRLSPSSAEPASMLGVFTIGVLASLSSCTAVVGGLVAAVSSKVAKEQEEMTPMERLQPHLLFNLGRIGGFFVLGAVIGLIGSSFQLSSSLNGLFVIVVALIMVIIGVNLLDVFPTPVIAMPKWLAHKIHDLAESKDPKAPVVLGAMTFFLPCGFTQSLQLFALTLQDPISSGLVMAIFALGTTPVLLGVGGVTSFTSGNVLKKVTQVAGVIVLVLGISNVFNGFALLGVTAETAFGASPSSQDSSEVVIEDGRQQIEMKMTSRGIYSPDTLVVQQGIPVDWTIYGDEFMGCGDTLVMPAFGVNTTLKTGKNLVQFTPTKSGKFTFSCSMGMIRGTMIVTPSA